MAALVYDTSNFGATSPVQGTRYRFEATPTFGSLQFTSLLGDYRRYFMPAPFYTIAARALHYGRYGAGGEDRRLFPLFIGYPTLVRGYDALFARPFPYVMVVHQAPTGAQPAGGHLHVDFYPPLRTAEKLKYLAGSEQGAGTFIADTVPEESAVALREAIARGN